MGTVTTMIRDMIKAPTADEVRARLASAEQAVSAAELARGEDPNDKTRRAHAAAIEQRDDLRAALVVAEARERKAAEEQAAKAHAKLVADRDEVIARVKARESELEEIKAKALEHARALVGVQCAIYALVQDHGDDVRDIERRTRTIGDRLEPRAVVPASMPESLTESMVRGMIRTELRAFRMRAWNEAGMSRVPPTGTREEKYLAHAWREMHELLEPM